MTQISVAVVDGQRTFADALASRLAAEPDMLVAVIANSVAATRRLLVGRPVGIILLDSELPQGFDLAAELVQSQAGTQRPTGVIMLGTVPEAARIVEALRAGIAGWIPKEDSIQHLLEVIHGVMRGEICLPPTTVGLVLRLLLHERDVREASQEHPLASLTPREREVLSYLAEGIGRREVAERMQLSANTIRSHLQNLMAKLEVHSSLEAVALTRRANAHDAASRATWS
jgi:DNA-binding NarL/FixJ family response regulator